MYAMIRRPINGPALILGSLLAFSLILLTLQAKAADDTRIKPFIGSYVGKSDAVDGKDKKARDLSIKIFKFKSGFAIDWTTVIPKSRGRMVTRQFKIRFLPAKRSALYRAGMRTNMFGKLLPLDPIKGDPYIWAAIKGKSLIVHGMHVTEDGGYELQVYTRTLTAAGMTVTFQRFRNGKSLKDISGTLKRVK
jgi:hypothetical protein